MEWKTVYAVLFGGLISLVASLLMFYITLRNERKKAEENERKKQAANAVSGYFKLLDLANLGANIDKIIDDAFIKTKNAGLKSDDAFNYVPASVGTFPSPNRLTADEIRFLLTKKFSSTISKVQDIEGKMLNNLAIWESYSHLKKDMEDWKMSQMGIVSQFDGIISQEQIPKELQAIYAIKSGQLNLILGSLMENLEKDIPASNEALLCYNKAARTCFGDLFPEIKIDKVKSSQNANP